MGYEIKTTLIKTLEEKTSTYLYTVTRYWGKRVNL